MKLERLKLAALMLPGIIISTVIPARVEAQSFVEDPIFECHNETSSTFSASYSAIENGTAFDTTTMIEIPGLEYQRVIWNKIKSIPCYGKGSSYYGTVKGIRKLYGTLTYTVNFGKPVKMTATAPESLISSIDIPGVTLSEARWVDGSPTKNSAQGIQITFKVNWGELLNQPDPCYLDAFENNPDRASNINLKITIHDLVFADKYELGTKIKVSSELNSYTVISSPASISLEYEIPGYDKNGDPTTENYSGTTEFKQTIVPNLSKNTIEISIGNRNITANKPSSAPNRPGNSTPPSRDDSLPIIRMYNPNSGEHLFTISEAERVNLVTYGWKVEQSSWYLPAKSDTPIYRLYNPNNGDHHYTTNTDEKDTLVRLGWNFEGSALYAVTEEEGAPIYRMYNPNANGAGTHHYTESIEECNVLRELGWNFEGIAWYGFTK